MQKAPLEFTIAPDGKIFSLCPPDMLADIGGEVSIQRTSTIEFDSKLKRFYIQLLNSPRTKYIYWWHLKEFLKAAPPEFDVVSWQQNIGLKDCFILTFTTYQAATQFELWIIPFLRYRDGQNAY